MLDILAKPDVTLPLVPGIHYVWHVHICHTVTPTLKEESSYSPQSEITLAQHIWLYDNLSRANIQALWDFKKRYQAFSNVGKSEDNLNHHVANCLFNHHFERADLSERFVKYMPSTLEAEPLPAPALSTVRGPGLHGNKPGYLDFMIEKIQRHGQTGWGFSHTGGVTLVHKQLGWIRDLELERESGKKIEAVLVDEWLKIWVERRIVNHR